MKFIRQNLHGGLRYEWNTREPWSRCLNQKASMLPAESHQFAQMQRENVTYAEAQGCIFRIEEGEGK